MQDQTSGKGARLPGTAARTRARKRAVDVLFAADLREESPLVALDRAIEDGAVTNEYSGVIVRGVLEHQSEIDALLSDFSREWTLERMPAVDRNVLRVGVWEILYADDVPDAVAVSEAVGLVKSLSTDESPSFVNGLLDAIVKGRS